MPPGLGSEILRSRPSTSLILVVELPFGSSICVSRPSYEKSVIRPVGLFESIGASICLSRPNKSYVYLVRFLGQPLVRLAFATRTRRSRRGVIWIPNMLVDATQAPIVTHIGMPEACSGGVHTKSRTAVS